MPEPTYNWDVRAERDLMRAACQLSFWTFFVEAYGVRHGPHRDAWFIKRWPFCKEMADWFEHHVREWLADRATGHGKVHYLAAVVSRDLGKTTLLSQAGTTWLHLQDPDISTYIGSEKTEFAVDILKGILPVLTGSDPAARFVELFGSWVHPERTWKDQQIVHAARVNVARKEPSFGTWGVESGLTGKHPDVLVLDDPTSYEKIASHANWLATVNNHLTSLIPVVKEDGLVMLVGTRYHDGDHFGYAFRNEYVKSITGMPMPEFRAREDGKWNVFYMAGRDSTGKPSVPGVWSDQRMLDFARKDPNRYAAQIMNDPSSSEFTPLTRDQLIDCYVEAKDVPYASLRYTIHCDTAFKSPERQGRGDESVFQIWGHTRDGSGDVYYIEGYGSNLWRGEEFFLKMVARLQWYQQKRRRIVLVTDEYTPGKSGTTGLLLQSYCHGAGLPSPPYLEFNRGGKKKDSRIREAAVFWQDGHVRLIKDSPGVDRLIDQMARIGVSDHDDWSDPAADVFHKDVYRPIHRLGGQGKATWLPAPQEDVLKDGTLRDEAALYDQWHGESNMLREPI